MELTSRRLLEVAYACGLVHHVAAPLLVLVAIVRILIDHVVVSALGV